MRQFLKHVFALITSASCFCVAHSAPVSPNDAFLFSHELRPGMQLTGVTSIQGTELTNFKGRILGVERGAFAGGNMIWVELEGDFLGQHGVAAGMSGSPCYVDGRLIGAVGYGFPFSQKPIAGVTPIESMLEVLELTRQDLKPSEELDFPPSATGGVWTLDELKEMALESHLPKAVPLTIETDRLPEEVREDLQRSGGTVDLKPLGLPLSISSREPSVYGALQKLVQRQGLELSPGTISGATLDSSAFPALKPGSAIGMTLMTGDLTVGGYGTVTHVDGDRLIAFGHPAFGWGTTDIPLSPCEMFALQPSYNLTFKLGQVAMPIGVIRQDRLPAIGGIIGPVPDFLPYHVRIKSATTGREKSFNFRLWDNRVYTPALAMSGLAQAIAMSDRTNGEATATATYKIGVEGAPTVEKSLFYSTLDGPDLELSSSLRQDLAVLKVNPFRRTKIKSLDVTLEISDRIQASSLVSVTADREVYRPGETVRLAVYLQPYRGERVLKEIELPLSADLVDGSYDLFVGDADSRLAMERERAPGLFTPMNFQQLVDAIKKHYTANQLYVVLRQTDEGLTVHGQELPSLPESLRSTFATSSERAFIRPITGQFLAEATIRGEAQIMGSTRLGIQVNRSGRR